MEINPQHNGGSTAVRHLYCVQTGHVTHFLACALLMALTASAQVEGQDSAKPPLYAHGFFPPGQLYGEGDLQNLIDKTLQEPAYLIGIFVYLGNIQGHETFSNYTEGLLNDGRIAFGRILIQVKFYDNRPPGLAIGKAIVATPAEPLTLKSVRPANGGYLIVETESRSAP
jgi:hypothetical protein